MSFYGLEVDESDQAEVSTAEIVELFKFLKPKASRTGLIRIGGDRDGAYLVPDSLDGIAACFSPGVNRIKYFEDLLADRYGIKSHMCDFTCDVDQFTTPLKSGQTFLKKWLDVNPGKDNVSLEDWIRGHDVEGDLLLQMDIEGAEFRNILGTSDETLARFRIMVIEVHRLRNMLEGPILREVIAPFFRKLARSFTTVHAHPNNCCGDFAVPGTDIRIPNFLEITLVRNDFFAEQSGPPALPHPLDVSRNLPQKAPLFLSDIWCDYERPLESRIKILEDTLRYRDEVGASSGDTQLASALSLTAQSLQTLHRLAVRTQAVCDLVEVARGKSYELTSTYGRSPKTGTVQPHAAYFFHTGFGTNQAIRVDLGRRYRIRRIEVTNRRNGHQERARHIFAVLDAEGSAKRTPVYPMYDIGPLPGGAWQECSIELPDVSARYVTITSPMNTALHLADLRVYVLAETERSTESMPLSTRRRLLKGVERRLRRLRSMVRAQR